MWWCGNLTSNWGVYYPKYRRSLRICRGKLPQFYVFRSPSWGKKWQYRPLAQGHWLRHRCDGDDYFSGNLESRHTPSARSYHLLQIAATYSRVTINKTIGIRTHLVIWIFHCSSVLFFVSPDKYNKTPRTQQTRQDTLDIKGPWISHFLGRWIWMGKAYYVVSTWELPFHSLVQIDCRDSAVIRIP